MAIKRVWILIWIDIGSKKKEAKNGSFYFTTLQPQAANLENRHSNVRFNPYKESRPINMAWSLIKLYIEGVLKKRETNQVLSHHFLTFQNTAILEKIETIFVKYQDIRAIKITWIFKRMNIGGLPKQKKRKSIRFYFIEIVSRFQLTSFQTQASKRLQC